MSRFFERDKHKLTSSRSLADKTSLNWREELRVLTSEAKIEFDATASVLMPSLVNIQVRA